MKAKEFIERLSGTGRVEFNKEGGVIAMNERDEFPAFISTLEHALSPTAEVIAGVTTASLDRGQDSHEWWLVVDRTLVHVNLRVTQRPHGAGTVPESRISSFALDKLLSLELRTTYRGALAPNGARLALVASADVVVGMPDGREHAVISGTERHAIGCIDLFRAARHASA